MINKPPEEKNEDFIHKIVKGSFGLVPKFGPIISELFEIVISPSIEKRRQKWFNEVYEFLNSLNPIQVSDLKNNEEFISIFLELSQIALRNHQNEKFKILKNILNNSFQDSEIAFDFKLVLIQIIGEITPTHIFILNFYFANENLMKNLDKLSEYYSKITKEINTITFTEFVYYSRDLENRKLLIISSDIVEDKQVKIKGSSWLTTNQENQDAPYIKVSKMGEILLKFIKE